MPVLAARYPMLGSADQLSARNVGGTVMASRFAERLQAGPLARSLVVAIAAAAVVAAVVAAQPVYGASLPTLFEVDTLADSSASDGHCSLREAVSSSNGYTSECGTGMSSTADSIHFAVGG